MGAAVACARVDVESLQEAYEVHISCRRPDTRRGEDSGPAVTEDITAFQEKKTQRQVGRVCFDEGRGDLSQFEISRHRFDFRIGLAATPVTSAAPRQFSKLR